MDAGLWRNEATEMRLCKLSFSLKKLNCYERIDLLLAWVRQILDVHGRLLSTREA